MMLRNQGWMRSVTLGGIMVLLVALVGACAGGGGDAAAPAPQAAAPAPAAAEPAPATAPAAPTAPTAPSDAAAAQFKIFPEDGMPQYGGQSIVPANEPGHLSHLHRSNSDITGSITAQVYDTLLFEDWRNHRDEFKGVMPGLAKSWKVSDDGTTYTFELQQGVKWHDGKPFTSADVEATFELFLDPPDGADPRANRNFKKVVDSVVATGEYTVVMKLKGPSPIILDLLANSQSSIFPKHTLETEGLDWFKTNTNGLGPWIMVVDEWKRNVSYLKVRNPDYWQTGLPYMDSKKSIIMDDPGAMLAAFETNKLDDVREVSPKQYQALISKYGDKVRVIKAITKAPHIQYNTEMVPFNDPKVRRALYLWADRQEFIQKAVFGDGVVGGWVNPNWYPRADGQGGFGTPGDVLTKDRLAYQVDKTAARAEARRLLDEAGWTKERLKTIKVRVVPPRPKGDRLLGSQVIVGMLQQIGFDATLDALERQAAIAALRKGDFGATFYAGSHGIHVCCPDLGNYAVPGGRSNFTRVAKGSEPGVEEPWNELQVTLDPQRRATLIKQLDEYLLQGTNASHNLYWAEVPYLRWSYVLGRKCCGRSTHERDDHTWLNLEFLPKSRK